MIQKCISLCNLENAISKYSEASKSKHCLAINLYKY